MPFLAAVGAWIGAASVTIAGFTIAATTLIKVALLAASLAYSSAQARKAKKAMASLLSNQAQDRKMMVREPVAPRRLIYGKSKVSGPIMFIHTNGTPNNLLHVVVALAGHECDSVVSYHLNDETIFPDGAGYVFPKYGGKVRVKMGMGSDTQAADPDLLADCGSHWTANHRLRGICYLYARCDFSQDLFPNGMPNFSVVLKGRKVYDPRTGLSAWSENAALCLADYLTHPLGMGIPYAELDETALIEAANVCDETVGTTKGNQKRYTCNGTITTNERPVDVIENMLGAMAGTLVYSGGKWIIHAGAHRLPSVSLSESDMHGAVQVQTRVSRRDNYNGVKGIMVSPEAGWNLIDFAPVKNDTYLAWDGGERQWRDVEYPFTIYTAAAQRLAKIELERGRQQITVQALFSLKAMKVKAGDTVQLSFARYGWVNKVFEVVEWNFQQYADANNNPALGVQMSLRETAPAVWDWANGSETGYDLSDNTTLPDPFDVAPPTMLTLASDNTTAFTQADGTIVPRVKITWGAPADVFVTEGGRIEIQYKRTVETEYRDWKAVPGSQTVDYLTDVQGGDEIIVRMRSMSIHRVPSVWVVSAPCAVSGDLQPPDAPTGLTASGVLQGVELNWINPPQADFDAIEIYKAASNTAPTALTPATYSVGKTNTHTVTNLTGGEIYYFWIRALDTSRNKSAWTASVWAQAEGVDTELQQLLDQVSSDVAKLITEANDTGDALVKEALTRNQQIVAEQTTRQTDIESLARDFAAWMANLGADQATIVRETVAMVTRTESLASDIARLQASFGDSSAAVTQHQKVQAATNTATASSISTLNATVGSMSSAVTTLQAAYIVGGQAVATWGFKLDANGKVVGMQAVAASGGVQPEQGVIVFSGADLQSANFVSGVGGDGWRLRYNGGFECRYALIRDPSLSWSVATPALSPGSHSFDVSFTASVSAEVGSTVRYTTDGREVDESSELWPGGGLLVTGTLVVRVRAFNGNRRSAEISASYVRTVQIQRVATPVISGPSNGAPGTCTISCATSGAIIWYEKYRSSGFTSGVRQYTTGFSVTDGDMVDAWATKDGMLDSKTAGYSNESNN